MTSPERNPILEFASRTENPNNQEYIRDRLNDLIDLKTNYSDDLPAEEIIANVTHGWEKYKCRTNFFTQISMMVQELKRKNLLASPEALATGEKFLNFCDARHKNAHLHTRGDREFFYTRENIELAERTINCCVEELSAKINNSSVTD